MTTALEDQIRAAFAFRAEHTETTAARFVAPEGGSDRVLDLSARRVRRWPALALAAAAVIAAALVGVALQRAGDHDPKPTVPADANPVFPVLGDPLAISLDAVPRSVPAASGLRYEVLDVESMTAAGWTITDEQADALLGADDTPAGFYRFQARLEAPDGLRFGVTIAREPVVFEPGPSDIRVDVGGEPGLIARDSHLPTIRWSRGDIQATLEAQRAEVPDETLVGAATAIQFVEVHALPVGDPAVNVDDQRWETAVDEAVLGGTLDGVAWAAEVDPSALRTIRLATPAGGSAMVSDRLSQPTDAPATVVELSITGVPGHGAIAYGWAPPAATAVRPVVDGAVVGELALYRRPNEAFFAVPIPDGVAVSRLVFVDETGAEVARHDLPPIPVGLG